MLNSNVYQHWAQGMKFVFLLTTALLVSGCATEVISSNARSVTISAIWVKKEEAFRLAQSECNKFNRTARLVLSPVEFNNLWTFDCVE